MSNKTLERPLNQIGHVFEQSEEAEWPMHAQGEHVNPMKKDSRLGFKLRNFLQQSNSDAVQPATSLCNPSSMTHDAQPFFNNVHIAYMYIRKKTSLILHVFLSSSLISIFPFSIFATFLPFCISPFFSFLSLCTNTFKIKPSNIFVWFR